MARRVFPFLLILFLLACSPTGANQESLAERASRLPGLHITFVEEGPSAYKTLAIENIVFLRPEAEDIWLYAPRAAMERVDENAPLRSWLEKRKAVALVAGDEVVYWLPVKMHDGYIEIFEQAGLWDALPASVQAFLWQLRGDRLRIVQDFEAAVTAYEQAIELDPNNAEANAGLGAAWLGLGQSEKAAAPLQRAATLDPNHYWAHRLLGAAYLNLQRYALAADEFAQAYVIRPEDETLLLPLALGLGRSGRRELALRVLDQFTALSDDPKRLNDAEALRREFGQTVEDGQ